MTNESPPTGPGDDTRAVDQPSPRKKIAPELMVVAFAVLGMLVVGAVLMLGRSGDSTSDALSPNTESTPTTAPGREPPPSSSVDTAASPTDAPPSTAPDPATLPPTTVITTTTRPATTTTVTTSTTVPASTTTIDPETAAGARLTELIADDATEMTSLEEQWVPQLSAKALGTEWRGVVYDYREILADHEIMRGQYGAILVDGATYSFRQSGEPMAGWFMTIVPRGYSNSEGALAWCTAEQVGRDDCFAKLITNRADPGQTVVLNDG